MIKINSNYKKLHASYLFSMVSDRVTAYKTENPGADIIKLGIGDVTLPLPAECIKYFRKGVEEMSQDDSFRGYGPYEGYDFLRTAIAEGDFRSRGVDIRDDEIFVSDGAKCDIGNFQELFAADTIVAVQDPVYPVYVDTNVMAGRTGSWKDGRYQGIVYLESDRENNFMPQPPGDEADLIYLCFPNNPTGATAKREELKKWVDYARKKKALILYDAAYEAYIRDDTLPKTIFEIDGARETAVEFRSFSKTAGFTGVRCAYTVIPSECRGFDAAGKTFALREMWARRHSTKFNGVSYPVQKAAEGIYTETGKKQIREMTDYYLRNAGIIREGMDNLGFTCTGGVNSPYIWVYTGTDSWSFFERILKDAEVVLTPGNGFGKCGEGYVRISAFNHQEKVEEAMERVKTALNS